MAMSPEKYFLQHINPSIRSLRASTEQHAYTARKAGEDLARAMLSKVLLDPETPTVRHDYRKMYTAKIDDNVTVTVKIDPTPKAIKDSWAKETSDRQLANHLQDSQRSTAGAKRFGAWFRARNGKNYEPKLLQKELKAYFEFLRDV